LLLAQCLLCAQLLTSTSYSVAQIVGEVGYESEPAFNRTFKREFGSPRRGFALNPKLPLSIESHHLPGSSLIGLVMSMSELTIMR
jgi:AraC-like DNA-binding protein